MGLAYSVLNGHFGHVYLLQVRKNDDEEHCFFKKFGFSSTFKKLVNPFKKVFAHLLAIWTDENSTASTDPMVVKNGCFTHITHLSNTLDRGLPH